MGAQIFWGWIMRPQLVSGIAAAAAIAVVQLASTSAIAATTTSCYGTTPGFSVTTPTIATSCVASTGQPNDINNGVPSSFPPGYVLLDKTPDTGTPPLGQPGWTDAITFTQPVDGSGSFTITPGS